MAEENGSGMTASKAADFSEWYQEVLIKSGFVDYTEVSGCLAFRPAAYGAWEIFSRAVDSEFKKDGIENVYFPMLIPEKFLSKEKEHVEGFAPEVAWVTGAGDTEFSERLAVRPTSETIMYPSYSKWIRSWRDLPMRYNQWNSVVRWEFKHPTPFIRSREFLWNEGHTVFASEEEAYRERDAVLGIYTRMLAEYLALPGIPGRKSEKEKFAGAVASFSVEHVMPDGWAIQGPDFHLDGQNFARAFEIQFLSKEGSKEYAWQNTYAVSTRELGVMVATHGDDKGLILPPKVAYVQIIVIPIYKKENREQVVGYAGRVLSKLKESFRAKIDDREGYSPGSKFSEWELRGVPLRIEIGERESSSESVTIACRDTGKREALQFEELERGCADALSLIQKRLYEKAEKHLKESIHEVHGYEQFKGVLSEKKGMLHAPWCGSTECEDRIKEETGAKITNIPFDQSRLGGVCILCGKKAVKMANFARSY